MSIPNTLASGPSRRLSPGAGRNSQPDPRPLTEYTAAYTEPGGTHSRITVTLEQPCIIRTPDWRFVSASDGTALKADSVTVVGNNSIIFDFDSVIAEDIGFVDVPYQDMQVQNFQGGFVRPGGQWFRKAV